MIIGDRVKARMKAQGLSQAELARRVRLSQPTIYGLITTNKVGSKHLHKIARELQTTPAYLTGETDDPDAGAPPPPPQPTSQVLSLPVVLPNEDGLARAFQGVLAASRGMEEDALARELAKRLPMMLGLLQGRLVSGEVERAAPEAPANADLEQRRA